MEKVLFLTWGIEFGGLEVVLLDWLSGIDYSKVSVVLACRAPEIFREKLAEKGLKVELAPLEISEGQAFWTTLQSWFRTFSSIRPEKIIFLEGVFAQFSLAAALAAFWSTGNHAFLFLGGWGSSVPSDAIGTGKAKFLYRFARRIQQHGFKEVWKHWLRARLLRRTFVASNTLKRNLTSSFGYPQGRISIVYHGVNTKRFMPSPTARMEFRETHGIPADAKIIVTHGRLARVKRPDRTLRAFEILSREYANLWLLITAYGPLKDEVQRAVASSDVRHRVCLVEFHIDSSALLKASDIYLMASDSEGFGISLVEAMATGLVCVATDCGGPGEILADCENGFLVEPTDEGVVNGMRRVLQLDLQMRARLSERARKTVEDRFEINAAIHSALSVLAIPQR